MSDTINTIREAALRERDDHWEDSIQELDALPAWHDGYAIGATVAARVAAERVPVVVSDAVFAMAKAEYERRSQKGCGPDTCLDGALTAALAAIATQTTN